MNKVINVVLMLVGLVIVSMGVNVGFGGIPTLGWFASDEFMVVADAEIYGVQDNHIRFLGGVWFAVGLMFVFGGVKLALMRDKLIMMCVMIAIAGLFRLSAMDVQLVMSAALLPSFLLETVGFPLLGYWLWRGRKTQNVEA